MEDKTQKLYQTLYDKGLYTKTYEDFSTQFADEVKKEKLFNSLNQKGLYTKTYEDFNNQFFDVKKKDLPFDPMLSTSKGETILQDFGQPSKEPIIPKLPYQSPKVNYEETLPESITPTSVMKSNASKGKFLEQKQIELSDKITTDFEKESAKLKSDYEKKLSQEGANKKQLKEEYAVRVDDLKVRKGKEAENEWDKLVDSDNYEYLAPEDVKGLGKEIDKVLSQQMPFDKREASLNAIRDSFLSKVSILPADIQNTIKREINEVFAKKTLFDEKGDITPYGWKKEASQKINEIQGAKNRTQSDFKKKYPDFYETMTPTPSGAVKQGFSPTIDKDPDKRPQFYADYIQYKKDLDLLGIAEEKLGNVMQTGDGSASFADAFRMGGRDLLAAVSSVGWSDVAKALENNALSQKVQKGEKLSEGEQALFDTYGIFDAYQQEMTGGGYKLGNVFAQSLPMMESIASLNVMGVLGGAGTATLKQIAKKEGIKKLLTKGGVKIIGKEAAKLGGAMAKGAPLTPQSWVRQQTGLAGQKVLNDKGEWAIDKATVEGKVEATLKGLATGGTELGSEILGGYMGEFGQVLRNIPGLKNIKLPKVVGQMAKTAGMQGAPIEIAEEFINMLWQAPIGDQPLSEITAQDIWDTIWTTAGLTTILGSAALPSGIMNTVQRNRDYNIIRIAGREKVAAVRDAIINKDQGALNDVITELRKGDLTEDQIKDVITYAKSIATEVVVKDNAPETKPQETGETFIVPQVGAEPLVFKTKQEFFDWLNQNGEEKLPSPNEVGYLDNNVYRAMDEWKIDNRERLSRQAMAEEEKRAKELETKKIEEETKDAERGRIEDQKVAEQGAPELVGQEGDTGGVRYDEQVKVAEEEIVPQESKDSTKPLVTDKKVESLPLAGETKESLTEKLNNLDVVWQNEGDVPLSDDVVKQISDELGQQKNTEYKNKVSATKVKQQLDTFNSNPQKNTIETGIDSFGYNIYFSISKGSKKNTYNITDQYPEGNGFYQSQKSISNASEADVIKFVQDRMVVHANRGTFTMNPEMIASRYMTDKASGKESQLVKEVDALLKQAPQESKKVEEVQQQESVQEPAEVTEVEQEISEDAQLLVDVIALDPNNKKYDKYRKQLIDEFGIDFNDIYKDDLFIKKANLNDIKEKKDFLNFDNWVKYGDAISKLRGFISSGAESRELTEAQGRILTSDDIKAFADRHGFKSVIKEYNGEGNLAGVLGDEMRHPSVLDLGTFIHEIGHIIETKLKYSGISASLAHASSSYYNERANEVFAENFRNYFLNPTKLKEKLPDVYNDIDVKIPKELRDDIFDLLSPKEAITAPIEEKDTDIPQKPQKPVKIDENESDGEKRTGFEKRETEKGTKGSIEKRSDEIGQVVKRIIDDNPHFYKETTREDEIEKAKDFISSFASFDNALKNLLKKTKNLDELTMRHVARQVMMQKLGEDLRDAMKSGDKEAQSAIADDIVKLEDITQSELRISATTLAMTMWQFLTPEATVFMVNRVVNEANKTRLGFEAQQAEDFINKWNDEVPESVKRLLSENPELRDFINKVRATADKIPPVKRATKVKAKEIATKVRALKSTNWGLTFADPIGATAIFDGALEVTARTIETTGNILQAINDGIAEIKKSKWYQSLTRAKQRDVEQIYNDRVRKEVDFDAAEYIEQQSWYAKAEKEVPSEEEKETTKEQKETQKAKREADRRLKDLIFDTIASHWLVEKTDGKTLTERLVENVGLTQKEAEQIAQIAEEAVKRDSQKIFDETLGKKIANRNTKTSAFDKFFKLIKRGALTNENYYEVFAKNYRLQPSLTQEQKNELQRLSMNANLMAPYGYFGDIAFNEFAQYMAKVTEQDSWVERQTRLMIAANYARMLSGITTSKVNLASGGMNLLIRPFLGVLNPVKWAKTGVLLAQGKAKEAHLKNPVAALSYAIQAYKIGAEIGGTTAINIVKNGNVKEASKYLESVNNIGGQNIPELEKNTFGVGKRFKPWDAFKFKLGDKTYLSDVNPWNAMKYSGRALLAEDATMFNMPFALELAMAARKEAILSGQFKSLDDLKNKILGNIAGTNLTEEQAKNIEGQLAEQVQMLRAVGIEPTPMQIKQRRFELTRTLLDLSQEEIEESTQLARGEIFTDKERGGTFSIIGDALGGLFAKNLWIKVATLPKIPFTGVLGRIADMGVDTTPGYGVLRAKGWSPSGIIARARQWERTGLFKDFLTSPAKAGLFKSAQMGVKGSALYERQMARSYFGFMILTTLAAIFLPDDDDERKDEDGNPFIDITGGLHYHEWNEKEQHYMGAYTAKIGKLKFRYLNYPILNTPFAIIGNYKDAQRAGKVTDDFMAVLALMGRSWFQSLGLVKDTWLAKGINDIVEMIGGGLAMMGGEEKRKRLKDEEIVEIDRRIQRQMENMRDDYTGLPIKYISPLKSNLLQQAIKFVTPESRLKGTGVQLWAYNVGLQWWNDKRTDIFGQEVKTLPGDQGTAWPRDTDERWANYWKYNVHVQDVTPKDKLVIKGVPQTLEWNDYITRKGLTQNLFKDRWDKYFASNTEEQLAKKATTYKVEPKSGNKTNMVDNEINDIWTKTKDDVKKYMFVWDKQVKGNEKLFDFLMKEGLQPDFYSPDIEDDEGKKIIVPFDKLLKANDAIMEEFVPQVKEFLEGLSKEELQIMKETVIDEKTGMTDLEDMIKWYWNVVKDNVEFDLKSEMLGW